MKRGIVLLSLIMLLGLLNGCGGEKVPQYYRVEFENGKIEFPYHTNLAFSGVKNIDSSAEFREVFAGLDYPGQEHYTDDFFQAKSLVIVSFQHPSTEKEIVLKHLVTDLNNQLVYVFSFQTQEIQTTDIITTAFSVEVAKETVNQYDSCEIQVLNQTFKGQGATHYPAFQGAITETMKIHLKNF